MSRNVTKHSVPKVVHIYTYSTSESMTVHSSTILVMTLCESYCFCIQPRRATFFSLLSGPCTSKYGLSKNSSNALTSNVYKIVQNLHYLSGMYLNMWNRFNCINFVNSRWHEHYELRKQVKKLFVFMINALYINNYVKQ